MAKLKVTPQHEQIILGSMIKYKNIRTQLIKV